MDFKITEQIQLVAIKDLSGLKGNPRLIKDEKYKSLLKSIKTDPDFLKVRPLLAYRKGQELIVYAGNQRLRACTELGFKEVPCIISENIDEETLKKRVLLDNIEFGDWDMDILKEEYTFDEIKLYDLPNLSDIKIDDFNGTIKDIPDAFDVIVPEVVSCPHCHKDFRLIR
jgi:ParB-like chromosome segregation protein Spo0J